MNRDTIGHDLSALDREKVHAAFEAYLTKLGLRQTKQRRSILDALMILGPHVDAETITAQARKVDSSIGLATVYRALQLMTESGVLVERQFGRDRAQFEVVDATNEHHDHLICKQCGAIIEFYDDELERLQETISLRLGFTLVHHRMELFANCLKPENCARREQK